jgi:RNA recognition motif-containing protein
MISLYVCDIPQTIEKDELAEIFSCFDGFLEVRIARDRNKQKIAFVDYTEEDKAKIAMNSTKSFRFPGSQKGITVRYSDNSKNKETG